MVLKDTLTQTMELKFRIIVPVPTPAEIGVARIGKKDYKGQEDAWELVPFRLNVSTIAYAGEEVFEMLLAGNFSHNGGPGVVEWNVERVIKGTVDAWVKDFIENNVLPLVLPKVPDAYTDAYTHADKANDQITDIVAAGIQTAIDIAGAIDDTDVPF